jgi:hypothetical protein
MDDTRFFTMVFLSYIYTATAGVALKGEVIRVGQYPQPLVLSNFRRNHNGHPISAVFGAKLTE